MERKSIMGITNSPLVITGIYENIVWTENISFKGGADIDHCFISIHDLDNSPETLHYINVDYLNTLTIPQSSHFDGEHIWLLVERNRRILMLKLLPNG